MSLNGRQIAAAHRLNQDVCVVAGPGSGKTSVLIERFSWLVREKGIEPHRILAITFTEKAATEIKQRLVTAFEHDYAVRERIERAYVSTIHAFCTRLLRENAIAAGLDPLFDVADETTGGALMRDAADEVLEAIYARDPARMRRFLSSLAVGTEREGHIQDLAQSLIDIYKARRVAAAGMNPSALEPPDTEFTFYQLRNLLKDILAEVVEPNTPRQHSEHGRFAEWAGQMLELPPAPSVKHFHLLNRAKFNKTYLLKNSKARTNRDRIRELAKQLKSEFLIAFYTSERELIVEAIQEIGVQYRAKKNARSLLDFSDLEELAIQLLESDAILLERIQSGFDYILMDELQDTNPLQWKLVNLVRQPNNFFAVGDINQSIFRFRHAEPELFRGYQNTIGNAGQPVDELRDNYRSRAAILEGVNHVFAGAGPGIEPHGLTSGKEFPAKDAQSIEIIAAFADATEDAARKEASWVARRISELAGTLSITDRDRQRPATYADIAILIRTNAAMPPIQKALDEFGIPSIVVGGRTFFEAREVKDLLMLLRVVANPCDEIALAGVLRSPLAGVGDECLLRLRQAGSIHSAFANLQFNGLNPEEKEALAEFAGQLSNIRLLRDSISPDRLLRKVIDDSDYESELSDRGRANVEKFLNMIRNQFKGSIDNLLDQLDRSSPDAEAPPSDFGNAVRLMSIHKSKGLEFPIVFLPGLHKGTGGHLPVITFAEAFGLGVKWRDPDSWEGAGDTAYRRIEAMQKRRQREEDDRLLYVAMTRAKEHMVLSFAVTKRPKSDWWKFICVRFGVNAEAADNQITVQNGVRVLRTDVLPDVTAPAQVEAGGNRPLFLPRAVPSAQYDSSASVTSVSLFAACPRKYYLSRYLHWEIGDRSRKRIPEALPSHEPSPENHELDASDFGLQVHALLAGVSVENADPQALALVHRFERSILGGAAAQAEKVEREFDFVMEIQDVVLRGQIDLWFEQAGETIIVDYKTDQVSLPIDPARMEAYALQLRIYAVAVEKLTGRLPDHVWLYFLRPDEAVEIDLSPASIAVTKQAVAALREAQNDLHFPLIEGAHCTRCEFYKGLCPAGRVLLKATPVTFLQQPFSSAAQP